jgi:hypothetical protein
MIDRFYAKPLSGEMNVAMLQSRRRRRKIYDGDDSFRMVKQEPDENVT